MIARKLIPGILFSVFLLSLLVPDTAFAVKIAMRRPLTVLAKTTTPQIASMTPSSSRVEKTITISGLRFGALQGDLRFNPDVDADKNGVIDLGDLFYLAVAYRSERGPCYVEFSSVALARITS
jgi:hypothetical protein